MTKKENFTAIREMLEAYTGENGEELIAFVDNELALLAKKAASPRKPSARTTENEGLKAEILAFLATVDEPKTIKDLQAEMPTLEGMSNQRVSRLLNDLVKAGSVTKEYVKKIPYFGIA